MRAIGLIKQLARRLAYQTLHDVVGRTVMVADLETLEATLRGLLDRNDCQLISPEPDSFVVGLLKYGLVNATLEAPRTLVESIGERGLGVVKATGFLDEVWEELEGVDGIEALTCLQHLLDGIVENRSLIKVLLQGAQPDGQPMLSMLRQRPSRELRAGGASMPVAWSPSLPAGFMPRAMTVEDACVTNGDHVWMLKHFYL